MKLVTIACPSGGRSGAVVGDDVLDFGLTASFFPLAGWIPASLSDVIAGGPDAMDIVRRLIGRVEDASEAAKGDLREQGALTALSATKLAAPIPRPGILLSHGRAYGSHIEEMKKGEKPPEFPVSFIKNSHIVIGPGKPIILPPSASAMVDFEGEISVVFSRPCHGVTAAEAMDYVLGFTIVNDVSARDWVPEIPQFPDRNRMGKQFPSFSPMGPWISTLDEMGDPADLHMTTSLNGAVMQDASTSNLIWSIPELIEYYSRWYPFKAGDVLTSGSPAGVGYGRNPKVFMQPGDVVSITVDGLGTLSNPVVAATVKSDA